MNSELRIKTWLLVLGAGLLGGMLGGALVGGPGQPSSRPRLVAEDSAIIEVAKRVSSSVVSITSSRASVDFFTLRPNLEQTAAGTGIIVSSDGLILTNKHVVPAGVDSVSVFTADGKEYQDARVVSRDPVQDIAFVKINANGLAAAELGDSAAMAVGQQVVAIGNALGQFQNTVTQGIISGIGRPIVASDGESGSEQLNNLFQTDAAINPGNSGGPLVNLDGQVIGVNTAVAGGAENIGFAIPINDVKPALASFQQHGRIVRPFLGVRFLPVTRELAASQGLKASEGAYLSAGGGPAVIPNSPAERAGLKEGDIITKVEGDAVNERNSLISLISKHKVGDEVTLTVVRGEVTLTLKARLEEAR